VIKVQETVVLVLIQNFWRYLPWDLAGCREKIGGRTGQS